MSKLLLQIKDRQGYYADQIEDRDCMTVGELKRILEDYDDDTPIIAQGITCPGGADFGPLVDTEDFVPEQCTIRVYLQNVNEPNDQIDLFDDIMVDENATSEEVDKIVNEAVMNAPYDEETDKLLNDDTYRVEWEEA